MNLAHSSLPLHCLNGPRERMQKLKRRLPPICSDGRWAIFFSNDIQMHKQMQSLSTSLCQGTERMQKLRSLTNSWRPLCVCVCVCTHTYIHTYIHRIVRVLICDNLRGPPKQSYFLAETSALKLDAKGSRSG